MSSFVIFAIGLGREVDFVVTEQRRPIMLVESKTTGREVSKHLRSPKNRFPEARAVQVLKDDISEFKMAESIEVRSALNFLKEL